jgi:hypothetical protein
MRYTDDQKRTAIEVMTAQGETHADIARELGIGASTLRRWAQEHDAQIWADTVDVHFGFLRDHRFVFAEKDASTGWASTVVYATVRPPSWCRGTSSSAGWNYGSSGQPKYRSWDSICTTIQLSPATSWRRKKL